MGRVGQVRRDLVLKGYDSRICVIDSVMVTLEPITPATAATFRDVRLRALRDAPTAFVSTHAKEALLTDDEWRTRATQWNGERSVAYLAMDGPEACGLVGGYLDADDPTRATLVSMWVAPEYRAYGVGRQLVEAVVAWARSQGVRRLYLVVTSINDRAIAFYDRLGFVPTGHTEPYENDPEIDDIEMVQELAPEGAT